MPGTPDGDIPISHEVGASLPDLLVNAMGLKGVAEASKYVLETSLLPFFGTCEFLVIFDRDKGEFQPIPEELSQADFWEVKLPPPDRPISQDWWVVKYAGKAHYGAISCKGPYHVSDFHISVLQSVGYKVIATIDHKNFKYFNGTTQDLLSHLQVKMNDILESHRECANSRSYSDTSEKC